MARPWLFFIEWNWKISMSNFYELVNGLNEKSNVEEYFNSFFTKVNFKNYELEGAQSDQKKAIKVMFESKKGLLERSEEAFSYNPFCKEAFFVYMMLSEDAFLDMRFRAYYDQINSYGELSEYDKECFIVILDFYVEFMLDIHNVSTAIKVQKMIMRLCGSNDQKMISRMAFMYYTVEDDEEFYRLYLNNEFDLYCYILLIVTLLKRDEEKKAEDVLQDMFEKYPYASYIDHLWDLDYDDPEQKEFYEVIEDCFDEISSVPCFFSWCNELREKYVK